MDISSVSTYTSESLSKSQGTKDSKTVKRGNTAANGSVPISTKSADAAVIVEKSEKESSATYSKKTGKADTTTIAKLKQEAEQRTMQLRNLVEKLLLKQSKTFTDAMDVYEVIRNGEFQVDDETRLQAQKDIAEDGYWGAQQTSERLFSFATALAGNDKDQADQLIEAFKKGYDAAKKQWGGELPELCQKTYDAFLQKMEDWKSSNTAE